MLKTVLSCLAPVVLLIAATGAGHARSIDVWGQHFEVEDAPAAVAAPPRFNALVEPRRDGPRRELDTGYDRAR